MFDVEIHNISMSYGKTLAVHNLSLNIEHGSFTTLLGPSGCGKTTLLRIIAGFLSQDSGEIIICGQNMRGISSDKRPLGIVFQDYALFPHMTVSQNIEYGLRLHKFSPAAISQSVTDIASILGLQNELQRYPHELSGGQQQRVALARILVLKPQILLMDEPLSNLDAKLRRRVREELKDLQRTLGLTTIYVTHDQDEAMSLSDYIAVIKKGELQQFARPQDIYARPVNAWTADFIGKANYLCDNNKKLFVVRPEWITLELLDTLSQNSQLSGHTIEPHFKCKIIASDYYGANVIYRLEVQSQDSEYTAIGQTIMADVRCLDENKIFTVGTEVVAFIERKEQIEGNIDEN